MLSILPIVVGITFGPAAVIAGIRCVLGPKAARATWRMALRWLYFVTLAYGSVALARRVWIDGVFDTDMDVQFGIALVFMILVAISWSVSWAVASTRWVRLDGGLVLR